MVEQSVRSQLVSYLEEHAFISPDQSAYLKGHSTQTSLHRVIGDWLENMNDNQITGVCLLDISKCFDTISHHLSLQKSSKYDIKNQNWKVFLPIWASANKQYCSIINFQVSFTSLVVWHKDQRRDHFFLLSLMTYRILRLMVVWLIYLLMPQGIVSMKCNRSYRVV